MTYAYDDFDPPAELWLASQGIHPQDPPARAAADEAAAREERLRDRANDDAADRSEYGERLRREMAGRDPGEGRW